MNFDNLLEWFSGKARERLITFVFPALRESAELGYWKKGVARQVRAALNKQNVAARWARDVEAALQVNYTHPLYEGLTNMRYGSYGRAPEMLTPEARDALRQQSFHTPKMGAVCVNEVILRWAQTNAEVAKLVDLLDSRRPRPVIVMKTLSPTVAQNITSHIGIDVSTIQCPESHGEWLEIQGKQVVYAVYIDWPDGTLFNQSRFVANSRHNQCQACGHAIKDPYNWVPLLAYGHSENPAPYALWVGRDCAKKLFGCEIEGDAIYPERQKQ